MPFDPAPKETEQEQRRRLGRIALEAIAARVLTLDPEEFRMGHWSVCAMGHCRPLPEVRATGLKFGWPTAPSAVPVFGHLDNYAAISAAFGITEDAALLLFAPESYPNRVGPLPVAARIREYLRATA